MLFVNLLLALPTPEKTSAVRSVSVERELMLAFLKLAVCDAFGLAEFRVVHVHHPVKSPS